MIYKLYIIYNYNSSNKKNPMTEYIYTLVTFATQALTIPFRIVSFRTGWHVTSFLHTSVYSADVG